MLFLCIHKIYKMSSSKQIGQVFTWIENNSVDYELLSSIVSEKAVSIEQTLAAYNLKYNKKYVKKLTKPMTKDVLIHIINNIQNYPQTFNNCNIRLCDNILHTSAKKYTHLPELLQKIKNENNALMANNRKLLIENINLIIKYESILREKDVNGSNEQMDYVN